MTKEQIRQLFDSYRERLIKCQAAYQKALVRAYLAAGTKSPVLSDMPRGGASELKDIGDRVAEYLDELELVEKELNTLLLVEKQLRRMVWVLPLEYSETIKLVYFDGLSRDDAAKELHLSGSGIRMRIKRSFEVLEENWQAGFKEAQ